MVRDVIVRELDVRSSAVGVSRLLRTERSPQMLAGTTWAPVGQTPVVTNTGARHSITMLSAVSAHAQPQPGSCAVRTPAASSAPVDRTAGRSRR